MKKKKKDYVFDEYIEEIRTEINKYNEDFINNFVKLYGDDLPIIIIKSRSIGMTTLGAAASGYAPLTGRCSMLMFPSFWKIFHNIKTVEDVQCFWIKWNKFCKLKAFV